MERSGGGGRDGSNPLNTDSANFDTEAYLSQMLKEKSLDELFDVELQTTREVRALESEMETLVYENYNKFITATDTIRKMQTDFVGIEEQMDQLADNIQNITALSDKLGGALSGKRHDVQKLAKTNRTLKSLQFLFDLPKTLQDYVDRKEFALAAKAYVRTRPLLDQYKSTAAFGNIYAECQSLVDELKDQLRDQLCDNIGSTKQTADAVESLMALGEPPETLAASFLQRAHQHCNAQLTTLKQQISLKDGSSENDDLATSSKVLSRPSDAIPNLPMDVLEFVDTGISNLLSDLSLLVNTYTHMFTKDNKTDDVDDAQMRPLLQFANGILAECFEVAERRFMLESEPSETNMVVRALDRFYRRLQSTSKMMPGGVSYSASSVAIVERVAEHQVDVSYSHLHQLLLQHIKHARQQLAAGEQRSLSPEASSQTHSYLSDQLNTLEQGIVHDLKSVIVNLLQLVTCDVTFSSETRFALSFSRCVRERLVVRIFAAICDVGDEFCDGRGDKQYCHATLILLLSRLAANLQASTASYVVDLCEQQLRMHSLGTPAERAAAFSELTPTSQITTRLGRVAQQLIDRYVQMEAHALSQLLVKSVQTRDWLGCTEPRAVRTVMKRLVEDLTAIDTRVAQLFAEGQRRDRSSEASSRRTGGTALPLGASVSQSGGVNRNNNTSSGQQQQQLRPLGTDSINQALGNLWRDRIDYFASVEMNKTRRLPMSLLHATRTQYVHRSVLLIHICRLSIQLLRTIYELHTQIAIMHVYTLVLWYCLL